MKFTLATLLVVGSFIGTTAFAGHHKTDKSYVAEITAAVESRTAEEQSRDVYRHPVETLDFFKVKPGMRVAEALPGGGWYSKILAEYLGSKGALYGVNYPDDMWARFGFMSQEAIDNFIASTAKFSPMVAEFTDNGISTAGFTFDKVPDELAGTVDRVLAIRALHNLNRFEGEAGTMTTALNAMHQLLKKGGMVGVVQHRLPESATTATEGQRGYLKQSAVIAAFEKAGFVLVKSSEINANPMDKPGEKDIVWRLPPSFNGAGDDEAKRAAMTAIGESDRMTLLFKKK